ncbi:hypothetical protein [Psychromonas antarctica]|uniref:hypothetical protein n=1 Tax=Psychromonas antarctica TaxID=67573 RepID=UPI001EE8F448|nr:hypothetical protein [Psychromonas antarctica]MCG6201799.1 hypothetical protein [Psychromonas antarctica]
MLLKGKVAQVTSAAPGIGRIRLTKDEVAQVTSAAPGIGRIRLTKDEVAQVTSAAPGIGRIRLTKDEVDIDIIDLNEDKMFVVSHELAAAQEYANTGITVNAYCPGVVEAYMWTKIDKHFSGMTGAAESDTYKKYVDRMTLDRAQTSEGVVNFVSYLSCPDFEGFSYYFLQRWLGNTLNLSPPISYCITTN